MKGYDSLRVAPFGNLRIIGCLRLPEAYRSLPRPSSLPGAKASTLRPLLLDFYFQLPARMAALGLRLGDARLTCPGLPGLPPAATAVLLTLLSLTEAERAGAAAMAIIFLIQANGSAVIVWGSVSE